MNENTPLYYGEKACEAIMHKYTASKLPPENVLFYHQGVFLSGMQRIYLLTGDKKYFSYVKDYVDSVIGEDGELMGIDHEWTPATAPALSKIALALLDNKQPSVLFYNLYDETGEVKYLNAIKTVAESMRYYPVNLHGGYWHKLIEPYQMWLDGAYMVGPLSVLYAERFGYLPLRERAVNQVLIMDEVMKDDASGLYFHGWDESKQAVWADKETGLSAHIWGRAVGWYAVAILDILEHLPKDHEKRAVLERIERELLKNLVRYQDEKTGLWFNVVDKPDEPRNWVESSCTNLFIYSYAKAIRTGVLAKDEGEKTLEKAYKGIIDSLYYDEDGYLVVDNVCMGTNIDSGTYEHYISRPRIKNDLHGAGAFVLMCAEMQAYENWKKGE